MKEKTTNPRDVEEDQGKVGEEVEGALSHAARNNVKLAQN
jgi:hypothetical protein